MSEERSASRWAVPLVTVAGSLFLGLIVWSGPSVSPLQKPTDQASLQQLSVEWSARWPEAAGDPSTHRAAGQDALMAGDLPEARARLTRSLAQEPDSLDGLLMLVLASDSSSGSLSPAQREDILAVVEGLEPEHPLLPVARAWHSPPPLDALPALSGTPLGALVEMRVLRAANEDAIPAAERVLAAAPGQPEACELVARHHILSAAPAAALRVLEACAAAGTRGGVLSRLRAEALDRAGMFGEAAHAYASIGITTHAAAIWIQEGGASEADIEALLVEPTPDVALHRMWWAILRGDVDAIPSLSSALQVTDGLEFEVARAAGALALGQPEQAEDIVGEGSAPQMLALQARALLAQGRSAEALAAVDAALAVVPWHTRLQLLRVSVLQQADPEAAEAALAAVVGRHPTEVAVYSWYRHRDMPWPALVPDAVLPTEGRGMLGSHIEPLREPAAGGGELVAGVRSAAARAAAGDREGALAVLEALAERERDAVGLQRLMVALGSR